MNTLCVYNNNIQQQNLSFKGKTETFWKTYNKIQENTLLKDIVIKSISDESNIVGEGLSKKVYNLFNLKDYIIRIHKHFFNKNDLQSEFKKPKNTFLNMIEGVVLSIPGKIDIVKRKTGKEIGVKNYSARINPPNSEPLQNISVKREETLAALEMYEQIKEFPVSTFSKAYSQMKKFNSKPGYQFDVISPNNILVDTKSKQINLIDPLTPDLNNNVYGKNTDFTKYHGADSLYLVLCDFVMHKEHIKNLNPEEKIRWHKAVSGIIAKSLTAAKKVGLERNTSKLKSLYALTDKFWKTKNTTARYEYFQNRYSGIINQSQTCDDAINHNNSVKKRIKSIKKMEATSFKELKPVFERIFEAPHQPKVEIPEILNASLDKISEYGKDAKSILPSCEALFDKEIFCTTKKRLFNLFINLQPDNERFLLEARKSANNPFEKILYKQEFEKLYQLPKAMKKNKKNEIKEIYNDSLSGKQLSPSIANKLWISRTCTNTGKAQEISIYNMAKAYEYIETKRNEPTSIKHLIELHKLILDKTPNEEHLAGVLRNKEMDEKVYKQIFNIKKDLTKTVNPYSETENIAKDLEELQNYIDTNSKTMDTFLLAANIFEKLIKIHPFYNGNGRSTRLFVEHFLLNKGYKLEKWPEEILYRKIYSQEDMSKHLKSCAIKE